MREQKYRAPKRLILAFTTTIRKVNGIFLLILSFFLSNSILAVILGEIYNVQTNQKLSLPESFSCGLHIINTTFHIDANYSLVPQYLYICGSILQFVLTVVISGIGGFIFSKSDSIIKIAPYTILNLENNTLSIRYWIKLESNDFLYNVSILVRVTTERQRDFGGINDQMYFRRNYPDNTNQYPAGSYYMQRDIWHLDLSLDDISYSPPYLTLGDALSEIENTNRPPQDIASLSIYIRGTRSDGKIVNATREYDKQHIIMGYVFTPTYYYDHHNKIRVHSHLFTHVTSVPNAKQNDIKFNSQSSDNIDHTSATMKLHSFSQNRPENKFTKHMHIKKH